MLESVTEASLPLFKAIGRMQEANIFSNPDPCQIPAPRLIGSGEVDSEEIYGIRSAYE